MKSVIEMALFFQVSRDCAGQVVQALLCSAGVHLSTDGLHHLPGRRVARQLCAPSN